MGDFDKLYKYCYLENWKKFKQILRLPKMAVNSTEHEVCSRKMFFLGREVQNEKIGGTTKAVYYYNKLKCPVCEKVCRSSFGKAMHIERFHPEIESGLEKCEDPMEDKKEKAENDDTDMVATVEQADKVDVANNSKKNS